MNSATKRRLADAADDVEQLRRSRTVDAIADEIRDRSDIGDFMAAIAAIGAMPHAPDDDLVTHVIAAIRSVSAGVADAVERRLGIDQATLLA